MARPQKIGLDYFPLDVDIDQDDKIALIEAKFGVEGFGIIIKVLMHIYKNGYFYEWTEMQQLLFSRRVNVDINRVNEIIDESLRWGLFDKKIYDAHKILTSSGIQSRYIEITKRRKQVEILEKYLLLDNAIINTYSNIVIVHINPHVDKVNEELSTQSKVKESKVKERKEKESGGKKEISHKTAFEFLEQNEPIKLEAVMMKYKKSITDFENMKERFNNQVDIEGLEYNGRILIGRLSNYMNTWVKNEKKPLQNRYGKNSNSNPIPPPKYF